MRSNRDVRVVHRGVLHRAGHRSTHRGLLWQHLGVEPALRVRRRHEYQPAHQLGILRRELKSGAAAEGVSHHVDLSEAKLLDDDTEIATDVDQVDLACAQLCSSVPLQMYTNDLAMLGQLRENRTKQL